MESDELYTLMTSRVYIFTEENRMPTQYDAVLVIQVGKCVFLRLSAQIQRGVNYSFTSPQVAQNVGLLCVTMKHMGVWQNLQKFMRRIGLITKRTNRLKVREADQKMVGQCVRPRNIPVEGSAVKLRNLIESTDMTSHQKRNYCA